MVALVGEVFPCYCDIVNSQCIYIPNSFKCCCILQYFFKPQLTTSLPCLSKLQWKDVKRFLLHFNIMDPLRLDDLVDDAFVKELTQTTSIFSNISEMDANLWAFMVLLKTLSKLKLLWDSTVSTLNSQQPRLFSLYEWKQFSKTCYWVLKNDHFTLPWFWNHKRLLKW